MWHNALPVRPIRRLHRRQGCPDGPHDPYRPLLPILLTHLISLHCLHETMDTEGVLFHQALYQREFEQVSNELLKQQGIGSSLLEKNRPMSNAIFDQFLWDWIRCQKSAKSKKFAGCRITLLNLLKGKRPSCGDRMGIVGREHATLGKQGLPMGPVEVEIVNKAALCFFNIRSCLINSQRKMIECDDNIFSLIDLFIRSVLKTLRSTKQQVCTFEQVHFFDFDGGGQRSNGMSAGSQQNTPVTSLRKIITYLCHFISIIKDQQPAMLAVLQPVFDGFHDPALICFLVYSQRGEQIRDTHKTRDDGLFTCSIDPECMRVLTES